MCLMYMAKKRDLVFDAVKLLAIFLMVWGHALWYFQTDDYYDDPVFVIIYSFHMPLFMTVVGFFSNSVADMSLKNMVLTKARQLIMPAVVFYTPLALVVLFKSGLGTVAHGYYNGSFWFLKSAFICFVLYYGMRKVCRPILPAVMIALVISMFIHDFKICSMFPYFLLGILLRKFYGDLKCRAGIIALVSGTLFLSVLPVYYTGGYYEKGWLSPILTVMTFWIQEPFDVLSCALRMILGISGTLFVIFLFQYLSAWVSFGDAGRKVAALGSETLGVYLFQTIFVELLPKYIHADVYMGGVNIFLYDLVFTPVVSVIVVIMIHYIIREVKKNRWLAFLILGKRWKNLQTTHADSRG